MTVREIELFLERLGSRNHEDNLDALRRYSHYYLVELLESEFLGLVFLQNEHVLTICPRNEDRSLWAVAEPALVVENPNLHENWNLDEVKSHTERVLQEGALRPLVLRPSHPDELQHGSWYLQDGSHTALGYAMTLLSQKGPYASVRAYVATNP